MPEETLTFASEEERLNAINALNSEPPLGVDRDEFNRELEAEIEKIQKAEIVEGKQEPGKDDVPPVEPPPPAPEDEIKTQLEKERQINAELVSQLQQTNQQINPIIEEHKTLKQQLKELQEKNEELLKAPPAPKVSKVDEEIDSVKRTIAELKAKKDSLEKDDLEGKIELRDKIEEEKDKLLDLHQKKNLDAIKEANDRYTQLEENQKKQREDEERRRKLEEKRRKEQEQTTLENSAIEAFRKDHKEFINEKSYEQMRNEYSNWAWQLASLAFGKPINNITEAETEIAVNKYINKTPMLLESVQQKGLKEPAELKQFLTLSEIELTRRGTKIDPKDGKPYKLTDPFGNRVTFPSHKAAWNYIKENNGTLAQEMAKLQNETTQQVVRTMGQRTNPLEINEPQVDANLGEELTLEQAVKILDTMDVGKITTDARAAARAGQPLPGNVELYNRALVKTGAPPITGE